MFFSAALSMETKDKLDDQIICLKLHRSNTPYWSSVKNIYSSKSRVFSQHSADIRGYGFQRIFTDDEF